MRTTKQHEDIYFHIRKDILQKIGYIICFLSLMTIFSFAAFLAPLMLVIWFGLLSIIVTIGIWNEDLS